MTPSAKTVVADAGPLIALSRVTSLSVLPAVVARTLVTRTVLDECLARPDRPEGALIQSAVLGVLVLAKRAGTIPQVRPLIERLVVSGYYLADQVIERAARLAGE